VPKRDELTGECRKLHIEEHNDLYPSPNTIRVIKSRRTEHAKRGPRMEERGDAYRVLVGEPKGKRQL